MPPQLRQGQFWQISDEAVEFAETRGRVPHERDRGCVVIEGNESLDRGGVTVTIVPTSSQIHLKSEHDVYIPHPPAPNKPCIALVEHVMTVLRSDLTQLVGPLPTEPVNYLAQILAGVVKKLGIAIA